MRETELMPDINLETVRAVLAPHAQLYRIHAPNYQTVLLQKLHAIWNPVHKAVLDVGGGTGLLAEAISKFFPVDNVVSIDVENRFLPDLSVPTKIFNGTALPFPEKSFDCVVMNNVLHHVPRQYRVELLSECRRVAGPIYIKDHLPKTAADRLRLQVLDMLGNLPFKGMVSAHYLDLDEWRQIAAQAGYQISIFDAGVYRRGLMAAAFPNRLEFLIRLDPCHI
jgi:SAM-dependent methyltransferase